MCRAFVSFSPAYPTSTSRILCQTRILICMGSNLDSFFNYISSSINYSLRVFERIKSDVQSIVFGIGFLLRVYVIPFPYSCQFFQSSKPSSPQSHPGSFTQLKSASLLQTHMSKSVRSGDKWEK